MPGTFTTTARFALRKLTGGSKVSDIDEGFSALAEDVDTKMVGVTIDTLAKRPAAGKPNALFRASDTGVLYEDNGTEWIQLKTGPNPAHFATGTTASNVITTGSTQLPANTLVRYSARISGNATAGTDGYATAKILRDGTVVNTRTMHVAQNGHGEGGDVIMSIDYLQATGGAHVWKVEVVWSGTTFAGTIEAGVLSFLA